MLFTTGTMFNHYRAADRGMLLKVLFDLEETITWNLEVLPYVLLVANFPTVCITDALVNSGHMIMNIQCFFMFRWTMP